MRVMRTSRVSTGSNKGVKRGQTNSSKGAKKRKISLDEKQLEDKQKVYGTTSNKIGINDLPPTILGLVLSKLCPVDRLRSELVCRRWLFVATNFGWFDQKRISQDELFSNTRLFCLKHQLANKHIEIILKRSGSYLRELDLKGLQHNEQLTYSLCTSFQHVPNLRELDLTGIQLTNSSLSTIGRKFPLLKSATFSNSFKNTMMDRGLSAFFTGCANLTHLNLSNNEFLQGSSFADLPKSLQVLNISQCFRLSLDGIRGIRTSCANLIHLSMDQVDTVTSYELNLMFKALKNLLVLKYNECYGSDIHDILSNLTSIGDLAKLKELYISENMLINDNVLKSIGVGCRSLEVLDLSQSHRNITDAGLRHIASLPSLTDLRLMGQRLLSDETLVQIARRGILKNLMISRCTSITNESVVSVIKLCKGLRSLDISFCVGVTPVIFNELNKLMEHQHGKSKPTAANADAKFRLSILRSGIMNNLPPDYSLWIKLVDDYHNPMQAQQGMYVAHFLNFLPLVMMV